VGFVNRGPTDNPAIRLRIGVIFEHLPETWPNVSCIDWDPNGTRPDVLVMGLPYDWSVLKDYDGPIIVDYPEDLLGEGTYLTTLDQEELKIKLECEQIKYIIVSSPRLLQQIPGTKAVCILEAALDRD